MAINDYFRENKLSRKANPFMVFKTLFYLSFLLGSYIVLLTINVNASVFFALWMILGLSSVFLVVNCGHDAIHGAFANRKWINTFMRLSYDLLGANSYLWGISHNGIHHTYTSIEEVDGDLVSVPFTRLTPNQNIKSYHRFQHMYVFFLYSFATLYWVFIKDYKKFFQLQSAGSKKSIPKVQYFNLFSYKIIYYSLVYYLWLTLSLNKNK